jgi:hypothetical protein
MEEDLRRKSIKGHGVKTQDRQECRRFVQEAKVYIEM